MIFEVHVFDFDLLRRIETHLRGYGDKEYTQFLRLFPGGQIGVTYLPTYVDFVEVDNVDNVDIEQKTCMNNCNRKQDNTSFWANTSY